MANCWQTPNLDHLQHQAHLYGVVRGMLREAGCPIADGCHAPTVVADWLSAIRPVVKCEGSFPPVADVLAMLARASKATDSAMLELAYLTLRRLDQRVRAEAPRPLPPNGHMAG